MVLQLIVSTAAAWLILVLMGVAAGTPTRAARLAAQPATATPSRPHHSPRLTPFQLVYLAYQGYFRAQGIPQAGQLLMTYGGESLTAETLVQAAIAQGRLEAEVLHDASYLQSVDLMMARLIKLSRDNKPAPVVEAEAQPGLMSS